jgi:protein-S-isoprenylcysteine O-methyltransferase Ste14
MNTRLVIEAGLTTLLMPGSVVGLFPYWIVRDSIAAVPVSISLLSFVPLVTGILGMGVLLHSIYAFAFHGKGTLAPIAPPKALVVRGLYRYTRNPMYLAVILILLSEAALTQRLQLLAYSGLVFTCFHLFVLLYEEPHLRTIFGESYETYRRAVPRWGIRLHPFELSDGA